MRPVAWASRAIALMAAATCAHAVAACGSGASSSAGVDARAAQTALQQAGWRATSAAGMPDTYTRARQVAYLETVSPDGRAIDLQFLESADLATAELAAARQHHYTGSTIENVIVLPHAMGQTVPASDIDALVSLLTR